jgi:uncharacterized cupin superfamily protein
MAERPECIAHWREIEATEPRRYAGDDEAMELDADFTGRFGLTRIGIHHDRLPPGHRTSYPHAERAEEEFVYVIEGTPDVWLDGALHRLKPGDAVGFPAGTGLCHTFLNNSDAEVRLLVVGERPRADNRVFYPLNPEQQALRDDWWDDAPERPMGGHDGLPDRVRAWRAGGRKP